MTKDKNIPAFTNYEEMAEFWDSHDLADYWEQTEPAEIEFSPQARRRYLISLDRNLLERIRDLARIRGISTESLVNLFLEQHLHEIEAKAS
ncbi:MAG TPA: CopG family antitoxin [Candidatus Deferrimicrobium sp.]|nr:CopG family antitoxin [Candidatus Kapabacteria bacterium]HLP57939.1 CopG family antitoxin [Candidatus Deferrimicrobium sp.]